MFGAQQMKQMQKMQKQLQENLQKMQDDLAAKEVEGSAGGGMVVVRVNGQQEMLGIKINPEVVNPQEVEMLEDLITVAVKDAVEKSKALAATGMGQIASGMGLPPGMF